jgi:hypothetical protein
VEPNATPLEKTFLWKKVPIARDDSKLGNPSGNE